MTGPDLLVRVTQALANSYRVEREVGSGGMAVVFLARDLKHNRAVALKVFRPELATALGAERFLQEIEIAARLQHPHIVPLYDSGNADEILYYVMPFVEGESLRGRLARLGSLPLDEAARITTEIALALEFAHRQGVVHRDIKPENVLLSGDTAMVADFGIARALSVAGASRLTQTGMIVGTAAYMSPEQATGEVVDRRSDVYSLACVTYEMLAGGPPFTGLTAFAVLTSHSRDPVPSLATLRNAPPEVDRVITKALAKAPIDRYDTATAFAGELSAAAGSGRTIQFAGGTPRRRPWIVVAGVAALAFLAVAIIAVRAWQGGSGSGRPPMIVVLPFENIGAAADQFFADGLTDEITSQIAALRGLGTISRTSAVQYAGRKAGIQVIGRELSVDYVLAGSVRTDRRPDGTGVVRIVPHLIAVQGERELWTDQFDSALTPGELFAVQEAVAGRVAAALNVTLRSPEGAGRSTRRAGNLAAYEEYLRGNAFAVQRYAEEPARLAIQAYERAIGLDSTFALAYARLAQAQAIYFHFFDRSAERLARAEAAVERAAALDSAAAETRLARGYFEYWVKLDFDRAMTQFERVREVSPNNSELLWIMASVVRRQGQWEQSVTLSRRAAQLDPRSPVYALELGASYQLLRRYRDAEEWFDRAIALAPTMLPARTAKAHLFIMRNGDVAAARAETRTALAHIDTTTFLLGIIPWHRQAIYFFDPGMREALERLPLAGLPVDSAAYYLAKADHFRWNRELAIARAYSDSARRVLEPRVAAMPAEASFHSALGVAYSGLGRRDDALREGRIAAELKPLVKDAVEGTAWLTQLAQIQVAVGDTGAALSTLGQVLAVPSSLSLAAVRAHPDLAPVLRLRESSSLVERPEGR